MNAKILAGAFGLLSFLLAQDTPEETQHGFGGRVESSQHAEIQRAFGNWQANHGTSWRVEMRAETRTVGFLWGGNAAAPSQPTADADFAALAQYWIGQTSDLHGVDASTLVVDRVIYLPLGMIGTTDKQSVSFRQMLDGVEVINGGTNVLFDMQGRLLSIDTKSLPHVGGIETTEGVDAVLATDLAKSMFRAEAQQEATTVGTPRLMVEQLQVGKFLEARLAWEVDVHYFEAGSQPAGFRFVIDAQDGSLLARHNAVHNFDVSGTVSSMATPGADPDGSGNPEVPLPMPYVLVTSSQGNATTDANGNFTIAGASAPLSVTVQYDGPWATLNNQAGSDYSLTQTLNSSSGNSVLMNPSSLDLVTAEANALSWVGQLRDWTRAVNPGDSTADFDATTNVNITSTCNAFFDGSSTNYYQAGGGCANTAYSSVVVHEMGHWFNVLYSSGNGSDGFGEGNADVFAMYLLDDPIVGKDFQGPGNHIRDGRNTRQFCGDANGGCYGQVHADGEVLGGVLWKVRENLKATHGVTTGGAVADGLFNAWMNAYDDSQIKSIIETHWLTLDDDNGDIGDGTPNYSEIDAAFLVQGFPGVGLDFVTVNNVTQLPQTQDEVGPYTVQADITALLSPPVTTASLLYRVNGGGFSTVPMGLVSGNTFSGDIPGQASPSVVEYYVLGVDSNSQSGAFPDNAPQSTLRFVVGIETIFFGEDFESGINGWTHVSNNGAQDDWQRTVDVGGTDGSFAKSGDPPFAPSPINIWGNDLGPSGFNGAYQSNVNNSLLSPTIDLSAATGSTLRFKRWLTVEDGNFDQARVLVNGTEVWANDLGSDTVDTTWVDVEVDISSLADGNSSVQLEFNLVTDGGVVFGGWNVDDVEILSLVGSSFNASFVGTPVSGVAPLSVSFTDQSSGTATGWSWDFGDGASSSSQSPSHVYGAPGTYTVSLTATAPGESDTLVETNYIVVSDAPPVADFAADVTTGVEPLTVNFSDLTSGNVSSWSWDFGDGASSSAQNPAHVFGSAGTYTVSLTSTGLGGSDGEVKAGYIVVTNAPPLAEFVADVTTGVEPLSVNFSDLTTGNVNAWAWDFGDGTSSSAQNPAHVFGAAGTYTVSLNATGLGGSDGEVKTGYIVVTNAPPVANFIADVTTGVETLSVNFSDLSSGNVNAWAWDFGDGASASTQNPSHTYGSPGTYTVSLSATGLGGSDGEVKAGYIVVSNAPPVAEFIADVTTGVEPLTVNFSDLTTGSVNAWAWNFGDGASSTQQSPGHTYGAAGTYTVSLTSTG
ncbi:MAG: PKD repeat protein, partial [Gammaproteobacteria bacterium]